MSAITIKTPGALAGVIPSLIGFQPAESIVILGLGAKSSIVVTLRIDLSDVTDAHLRRSIADSVDRTLTRAEAHRAFAFVYTTQTMDDTRHSVEDFNARIPATHTGEAWYVGQDTISEYGCRTNGCCPQRIQTPDEATLAAFPTAHTPHMSEDVVAGMADDTADAWTTWLTALDNPADTTEHDLGVILREMGEAVSFRDAALISLIPGQREVAAALIEDPHGPGVKEALSVMLTGIEGPGPEQLTHLVLLERLFDNATDEYAPAPATLAAMVWWWKGERNRALSCVARAYKGDPTYRLAQLIQCALDAEMEPGWLAHATAA